MAPSLAWPDAPGNRAGVPGASEFPSSGPERFDFASGSAACQLRRVMDPT